METFKEPIAEVKDSTTIKNMDGKSIYIRLHIEWRTFWTVRLSLTWTSATFILEITDSHWLNRRQ